MKKRKIISILMIMVVLVSQNFSGVLASEMIDSNSSKENVQEQSVTEIKEYKSNEIIVKYKEDVSDIQSYDQEVLLTEDISIISVDNKKELAGTIDELQEDKNIEFIQPNYVYQLMDTTSSTNKISNDEYSDSQWAYKNTGYIPAYQMPIKEGIDINMEAAWKLFANRTTKEVVVAVVDTGVDYMHPDLAGQIWTNSKEVPGNGIDDDRNGYIDDYYGWNTYDDNSITCDYSESAYNSKIEMYEDDHGTHVAGIIGAKADNGVGVAGVAGNINLKIMSVKALGKEGMAKGSGTTASITKAIEYAESMGATICNLSVGGGSFDPALLEAIQKSNMLFVVAAGNGNEKGVGYNLDNYAFYPACYDSENIITVGNLSHTGSLHDSSNYGKRWVHIAAPGTDILSPWVNVSYRRKYQYVAFSGTSMSAPMVSGVAALYSAYYNTDNVQRIKGAILNSSRSLDTLQGKVKTGGMLDAYQALKYQPGSPSLKITQKTISKSNYKNLYIQITDPENDITHVRYAKGKKTIGNFKKGTAGIKVSYGNKKAVQKIKTSGSYTIYVRDKTGNEVVKVVSVKILSVTKVTLSATKKTIARGKTYRLKAKLNPKGVYSVLKYKSSNTKVATVSSKGLITGKKKGTATITVVSSNGKKATCKVIVR